MAGCWIWRIAGITRACRTGSGRCTGWGKSVRRNRSGSAFGGTERTRWGQLRHEAEGFVKASRMLDLQSLDRVKSLGFAGSRRNPRSRIARLLPLISPILLVVLTLSHPMAAWADWKDEIWKDEI